MRAYELADSDDGQGDEMNQQNGNQGGFMTERLRSPRSGLFLNKEQEQQSEIRSIHTQA